MIPESREVFDHGSREFDRADRRRGTTEMVLVGALVGALVVAAVLVIAL